MESPWARWDGDDNNTTGPSPCEQAAAAAEKETAGALTAGEAKEFSARGSSYGEPAECHHPECYPVVRTQPEAQTVFVMVQPQTTPVSWAKVSPLKSIPGG